jgi:hypothetical protein
MKIQNLEPAICASMCNPPPAMIPLLQMDLQVSARTDYERMIQQPCASGLCSMTFGGRPLVFKHKGQPIQRLFIASVWRGRSFIYDRGVFETNSHHCPRRDPDHDHDRKAWSIRSLGKSYKYSVILSIRSIITSLSPFSSFDPNSSGSRN